MIPCVVGGRSVSAPCNTIYIIQNDLMVGQNVKGKVQFKFIFPLGIVGPQPYTENIYGLNTNII